MEIKSTNINGIDYYTVPQFAIICQKGSSQIYDLIKQKIIKFDIVLNQKMIPTGEITKAQKYFSNEI